MTTASSSSATSCCEYRVLNRQLQAVENRDGCADRRRESPSIHLIEHRIELKVRIIIITQISHYSHRSDRLHFCIITSVFKYQCPFVIQVEVRELATIYSNQQEIDTRMVLYIHRDAALAWIQEHSIQNR